MSRIKVLRANPRRTLAALATLLIAVGITAASGATFTAQSANAGNTFSSGTLTIGASSGAALFNMTNIRPGATATGVVDIENTGTLGGTFTLSRTLQTDTGIANMINLVVKDCGDFSAGTPTCDAGDTVKYTGTLAEMGTAGHAVSGLGTFASLEKHKYQFVATFDSNAGDSYQNKSATATFTWNAS